MYREIYIRYRELYRKMYREKSKQVKSNRLILSIEIIRDLYREIY